VLAKDELVVAQPWRTSSCEDSSLQPSEKTV
jgi:hypothetical protein